MGKSHKINSFTKIKGSRSEGQLRLMRLGNNPMVGATVAVAVSVEEAAKAGKF